MTSRPSTSKLNNFKELVEIGRGGFGVVFSAKRENGEKVAVKKIDGRVARDRVWNEIKSMRSLKHRNIVEFYEDFVEGGDTYVVMELCEHGSLRSYVKNNGHLEEKTAAHVLRQLISAVTYMHKRGVLHRDLSAGNVFIKAIRKSCLIVKLGDFGLATNLRQGETACTIVGTPGYIAPQVYNQDYDQSADVYSLGGVLYTMLTSRDPPSKGQVVLNGLSSNSAQLVERMMHLDARRRIALTEIAITDFMRDVDEDNNGLSKDFSIERRIGRSTERRRSRDNGLTSSDRLSRERRERMGPLRSSSQPVMSARRSYANRPVNDRPPTTSSHRTAPSETANNIVWPFTKMKRCGGQRVRTAGGRYIVESDNRARFEVAAKGDVIHRILVVEIEKSERNQQTVYVHMVSERKQKCREENDELIGLTTSPMIFTSLEQLPKDVYSDYMRLVKMVTNTIRSRVPKITFRRPPQFPEAAAQLMENGDLRIKFSRSLIVRKSENGEVFNCIDGMMSKKEGVHGTTLTKVNEILDYLKKFESCLHQMPQEHCCFPIVFSAGPNVNCTTNTSPTSVMPSTASTQPRFAFSNISNTSVAQIPRSAPFQVGRKQESSKNENENSSIQPKFKLKMDKNNRTIAIHANDGRFLRQSTRDLAQFIFTDPAIRSDEIRFRRNERTPERAVELLRHLLPKLTMK